MERTSSWRGRRDSLENVDCQGSRNHREEKPSRHLGIGIWRPGSKSGLEGGIWESSLCRSQLKGIFSRKTSSAKRRWQMLNPRGILGESRWKEQERLAGRQRLEEDLVSCVPETREAESRKGTRTYECQKLHQGSD